MKKITMAILAGVAVAGVASADISVLFKSQTALVREGYTTLGPGQGLEAGAYVQLIWKADNAGYQSDNLDVSLLNAGEYLLADGYAGAVGIFDIPGGGVASQFSDSDVGGNNILNGYFYARVFERGTVAVGDYFLEMGIQGSPLTEYDPLSAGTTYSDNMAADVGDIWIDSQGTTVVPEPATIGLMGVAGIGMFLARKKSRR